MAIEYLFVYGTLLKDANNEMSQFLNKHASLIGKGYFYGKLYEVTWYPGAVLSNNVSDKVFGMVYKVNQPNKVFKVLDNYEGIGEPNPKPYLYTREQIIAFLEDENELKTWVYLYNLPVKDLNQIISGDFLKP